MTQRLPLLVSVCLAAAACGPSSGGGKDAGSHPDASSPDAGATDGGSPDGGRADGGGPDGGSQAIAWCQLVSPAAATFELGRTPVQVLAQVWAPGVTDSAGAGANITAELGYGPAGSDPRSATAWTWIAASYDSDVGNNDQYKAPLAPSAAGGYAYAYRFSYGAGASFYCDTDGNDGSAGGFDPSLLGQLTVTSPTVDWGALQGAASQTITAGQSVPVDAVVYAAGITDQAGQGQGVAVEIGYGPHGSDPRVAAGWSWAAASYKSDADGATPGDHANDLYELAIAPTAGDFDVAARAMLYGGPDVYLDLDSTTNGFQLGQLVHLTVSGPPSIGWCDVDSPATPQTVQVGRAGKDSVAVRGQVWISGVTDASGQGAGVTAELGLGLATEDPRSGSSWQWKPAAYDSDQGNNDQYAATLTATATGSYAFAYRFTYGGATAYCGAGGNAPGAFNPATVVALDAVQPTVDWGGLDGAAQRTAAVGQSVEIDGEVWADGITNAAGQGAGVTVEAGYGPHGTDATTAGGWTWSAAAYKQDNANNDVYAAALSLPAGDYDVAMRATLLGGPPVYLDLGAGTTDGFQAANEIELVVAAPSIQWTQVWPFTPAENAGAQFFVVGDVYAPGLTDAPGQGAGITAAVGYGPHGSDASTWPAGNWTNASYVADNGNNDQYGAWMAIPAAGAWDVAMQFTLGGTTTYADTNGNTPYAASENAAVQIYDPNPADVGWCDLQFPQTFTWTSTSGAPSFYGQFYAAGYTDTTTTGPAPGFTGQLGLAPWNAGAPTDPRTAPGWIWFSTQPTPGYDFTQNNDEYMVTAGAPPAAGTYGYAFRFRGSAGWSYCQWGGNSGNAAFAPANEGTLTVQ